MGWFQRSTPKNASTRKQESLSLCERVTASPVSPQHLRKVAPGEELKPSGGLDTVTLCGSQLQGWDLCFTTKEEVVKTMQYHRNNPEHKVGRVCEACAEAAVNPSL